VNLPTIIVHGGAGDWKEEKLTPAIQEVEKAARIGFQILKTGGQALDAAEACTLYMEECGKLNAGIGARPNREGVQELDAMIVDGANLRSGAVMAVTGIRHPISLARFAMEKTTHSQFAGEGVRKLYDNMIAEGYRKETSPGVTVSSFDGPAGDTVGCVAIDSKGHIAATSSTGGIPDKMAGRVGDSPIFGAGAYADDICGATATGWGEHIIRVLLCKTVVSYVEDGAEPQAAAERGIDLLHSKTGSQAGVVVADRNGRYGLAMNTKAMPAVVISGRSGALRRFTSMADLQH
jgi:beta-aspartyl-peptidase (threonine type)